MPVKSFGSCTPDATTTIRAGAFAASRASSRFVRRKCPRWFTPNVISYPSGVSVSFIVCTPALQTSAAIGKSRRVDLRGEGANGGERAQIEPELGRRVAAALRRDPIDGFG